MLNFRLKYGALLDGNARAQLPNAITGKEAISTRPENATEDSSISLNTSVQRPTTSVQKVNNNCSAKKISGFRNGDYCFLTNVSSFRHMHITRAQKIEGTNNYFRPDVSNILEKMSKLKDNIPLHHPDEGNIVKVFSQKMKFFCRAKIIRINNDSYNVFYIDYGFYENFVPSTNIFELDKTLKNEPEAAVFVGMRDTCNIHFSPRVKYIFSRLKDKVLVIEFDEDSEDLRNVRFKNPFDGSYIDFSPPELVLEKNRPMKTGDPVEFFYDGRSKSIYIRSVMLFREFKNILEQLKEETDENLIKLSTPKPQNIVSVYSNKEGGMCRGKVISVNAHDKIKCRLIDHGTLGIFPQVYRLPNKYSIENVPMLSHKITLEGLTNKMWDHPAIGPYLSSLTGKIFVLELNTNWREWNKEVVLKKFSRTNINEQIKRICI